MARIMHLVLPRCGACDEWIPDFEGCAAIQCGRRNVIGSRVDVVGGCGAKICGWCLAVVPPHELHHGHVTECKQNPTGDIYPPVPHPETWKAFMSIKARERVFCYIERQQGAENRSQLYEAVRAQHPALDLSDDWLESRQLWMTLMMECGTEETVDITQACTCLGVLVDMGYPDSEVLRRAILFCNCSITDIVGAMRALADHE